jgi:hypothetical protein
MSVYNRNVCRKSELKTKIPSIDYESSWDVVRADATSQPCNVITSPVLSSRKAKHNLATRRRETRNKVNGESNVYGLLRHTCASLTTNREAVSDPEHFHSPLLQPRRSVGPK